MNGWRFRTSWFGKLILQRQIRVVQRWGPCFMWRDATTEDLGLYYQELKG
jgi:hypothetical protein